MSERPDFEAEARAHVDEECLNVDREYDPEAALADFARRMYEQGRTAGALEGAEFADVVWRMHCGSASGSDAAGDSVQEFLDALGDLASEATRDAGGE